MDRMGKQVHPHSDADSQPGRVVGRNGYRTVVQVESLLKTAVSGKGIGGQTYTHASQLEVLPVFAETSAALDVKQQIAVFHPDVASDVAATQRHGLGRIRRRGGPGNVIG